MTSISRAYRTGETARAVIFIYPFLMLPAGMKKAEIIDRPKQYWALVTLLLVQTIVMQLIGDYWW